MLCYNIQLDSVAEGEVEGEQLKYWVHMKWESNLSEVLANTPEVYELYRVEDGVVGDTPIATSETLEDLRYTEQWQRKTYSYPVQYIVRGRDADGKLSWQLSNPVTFIIPGYDKRERMELSIDADYYSRFDVEKQENHYWNAIELKNRVGNSVEVQYLEVGSELYFVRKNTLQPEEASIDFAKVTIQSINNGTINAAITILDEQKSDDYKANQTSWTFTYNTGEGDNAPVDFGNLTVYDNMVVSTEANTHPSQYVYQVQFRKTAKKFWTNVIDDEGNIVYDDDGVTPKEEESEQMFSNMKAITVHKTESELSNSNKTLAQVDADTKHTLEVRDYSEIDYNVKVKYWPTDQLFRYDAFRWVTDFLDVGKTFAYAQNNGATYALSWYDSPEATSVTSHGQASVTSETMVTLKDMTLPKDEDENYVPNLYNYVPVINAYPPKGYEHTNTYNTYGGPHYTICVGSVDADLHMFNVGNSGTEQNFEMSTYSWKNDGKNYAYYNILVDINKANVPAGYAVYKFRTWRIADAENRAKLAEIKETRSFRISNDYLFDELNFFYPPTDMLPIMGQSQAEIEAEEDTYVDTDHELRGTFGAQRVGKEEGDADNLKLNFLVRMYFAKEETVRALQSASTQSQSAARRAEAQVNGDFYVVEKLIPFEVTSNQNIITGLDNIGTSRPVVGVTYYNVMGVASSMPFHGVNIVVTRYSDGTTTTRKVVR